MKKFSEINIGDSAEITHLITEDDQKKFVELTGDDNKIHTDKEFAMQTPFKKPVVHGMLGASFISTIIGTKLPGDGALWFSQNLEFLLPVRVGDEITIKVEVTKKIERDNVIELRTEIKNQHKQKVTSGVVKVKIIELNKEAEKETTNRKEKKVALVIGGTGGIGKATCLKLASDGFDVAIHYHNNQKNAEEIKASIEKNGKYARIYKADISSEVDVKDMIEHIIRNFGKITAMVNCSTIKIANIRFSSMEWKDIEEHIMINIKGSFNLVKYILPVMEMENYGKIIFITTQSIEIPSSEWLAYITAKAALHGFAKSLAFEYAPKGIRINMVSPGMTETELIADIPEKMRLLSAAKAPLRRLASPEDVAGAISFLASDRSDYLAGETIRVNGGQVMI
jgi:3-oxoacyl-[acyl-carrier protein] reductase